MIPQPPQQRNQLTWHVFKVLFEGQWNLVLPVFYAELFSFHAPGICDKSISKTFSQDRRHLIFILRDLTDEEVRVIEKFVETYSEYFVLGRGPQLNAHFIDELDFCIALGRNFRTKYDRTEIGQLEYEAKWNQSKAAMAELANRLEVAIHRISPYISPSTCCITYIPSSDDSILSLPQLWARELASRLGKTWSVNSNKLLVDARLTVPKPSMKDVNLKRKIEEWGKIVDNRSVVLSQSVMYKTVIVIDDLYQSGVTMWSYAKYLKFQSAQKVIGLVCVKAGADTDNVSRVDEE